MKPVFALFAFSHSRARILLAVAVLQAIGPASAIAQNVPGTPFQGRQYYFTNDESPIQVRLYAGSSFTSDKLERGDYGPPVHVFSLPRAFIFSVSGYQRPDFPRLPDPIHSYSMFIGLVLPEGVSFGHTFRAIERLTTPEERKAALTAMRFDQVYLRLWVGSQEIMERIRLDGPDEWMRRRFPTNQGIKWLPDYEGLRVASFVDNPMYFGVPGVDQFIRIWCFNSHTRPDQFCQAEFDLTARIAVNADFVDFRKNGGRAFANDRIRAVRTTLCKFIASCLPY